MERLIIGKKQTDENNGRWKIISDMPISSIFLLNDFFPHRLRHRVLFALDALLTLSFLLCALAAFGHFSPDSSGVIANLPSFLSRDIFPFILGKSAGIFFLVFSVWLFVYMLEAFHRSLYYHNREHRSLVTGERDLIVSEVAELFYRFPNGDILKVFLKSPAGRETALRLDVYPEVYEYLKKREDARTTTLYEISQKGIITREDLSGYLFDKHREFADFLFSHNISKETFLGAVAWAVKLDLEVKFRERWWSKERLQKFPAIGKEWAYGGTYVLNQYSTDISSTLGEENSADFKERRIKYAKEIEAILSKKTEANVLLIGDDGVGKIEIIRDIARRVVTGNVPPELVAHRLVRINTDVLISGSGAKNQFEIEFMKVLIDANKAGNIVLVFNDFAGFLQSAKAIGSDALALLDKHLGNTEMQIVALSSTDKFHGELETNSLITSRFQVVKVSEPSDASLVGILEDYVPSLEREYGIFFTYPAILEIARSAKYYISEGVMPDKALDLLIELAPKAAQSGDTHVSREDIQKFVSQKTNIPMGEIDQKEKKKLEGLEQNLHKLVVGQDRAIRVLADSLRRNRAGIRNMERPVGSYLFLGPTGVGKTQTAKAIAEVYFGDSSVMSRIDMSEYRAPGSLERLIGSFSLGKVGTLTTIIKKRPYGVLLLDEFEKASREVHDLFLQILDEGFFTDMGGRKVNARNLIFIATSNAGSDKIWEASKKGLDTSDMKDKLIQYIIESNIYRPEFLNRFDDVVVFHPLDEAHLREIAKIMLTDTKARIREQGYDLTINDVLIDYVMQVGYDPTFGARPMARAIKDTVEQQIAKKIISGALRTGERIEMSEEDLRSTI